MRRIEQLTRNCSLFDNAVSLKPDAIPQAVVYWPWLLLLLLLLRFIFGYLFAY